MMHKYLFNNIIGIFARRIFIYRYIFLMIADIYRVSLLNAKGVKNPVETEIFQRQILLFKA